MLGVLPFEFPGVQSREVIVISSLMCTLMALGFAVGPMVIGLVAQYTGELQTGLLVLCLCTGLGVIVGWFYPNQSVDGLVLIR